MRTPNVQAIALLISTVVAFLAIASITEVAHAGDAEEVAIDSAVPPEGFADVIIEASVTKPANEWGDDRYPFDFIIGGRRFSHKVESVITSEEAAGEKARFAIKLRIRLPEGKRVIKFDSQEKLRPLVTSAVLKGGKVYTIQFRPIYKAVKGKTSIEYEAWMEGKKLPIRYERFNIH